MMRLISQLQLLTRFDFHSYALATNFVEILRLTNSTRLFVCKEEYAVADR